MAEKKQLNPVWAAAKPFVNGGASGMLSTMLIQPIDMVKVRIQLGEKGNPVSAWHRWTGGWEYCGLRVWLLRGGGKQDGGSCWAITKLAGASRS